MTTVTSTLILLALAFAPQEETVEDILAKLESSSEQLNSFRASFYQVENDEFGDETILRGTMEFLKGGRIRMAVITGDSDSPVEESITDGKKAWMIRHKLNKVEVVALSSLRGRLGGFSQVNVKILRTAYNITYKGVEELESGQAYHLYCKPIRGAEGADPSILSLELWINTEQPSPIVKVKARQRGRIVTTLTLSNIQRNVSINPRVFKYRVPRGYEEIVHD